MYVLYVYTAILYICFTRLCLKKESDIGSSSAVWTGVVVDVDDAAV